MILATGLRTVELKAPITEEYAQLAKLDEIDETQPDTDEDGLPDYKEINFSVKGADGKLLIKFVNGVVDLPTYGECVAVKSELTYVERGLNRFNDVVINDIAFLSYVYGSVHVLPIVSDPISEDGDGEGFEDYVDIYPLKKDNTPLEFRKMYFANLITDNEFLYTDDGFYICSVSVEEILKSMNCDIMDESGVLSSAFYDDWYFYAVESELDYIYSIVKLREPGDTDALGNLSTCGVAVPFCKLDMTCFNDYEYANSFTIECLDKVAIGDTSLYDDHLSYYFSKTSSCGSYLIGKLYIQKVLKESFGNSNKIEITSEIGNVEAIINQVIYGVRFYFSDYAQCPDFIEISDVNAPNKKEIYNILRYTLGSTSLYSFAAEVQAHAIFTYYVDNIEKVKEKICQYILDKNFKYIPDYYKILTF